MFDRLSKTKARVMPLSAEIADPLQICRSKIFLSELSRQEGFEPIHYLLKSP